MGGTHICLRCRRGGIDEPPLGAIHARGGKAVFRSFFGWAMVQWMAASESNDGRVGVIDIDGAAIRQCLHDGSVVVGSWIDLAAHSHLLQRGVGDHDFLSVIAIEFADDLR